MSPSVAPESEEPYWAIASFSSGHLQRLDRELHLVGAAVELDDAGIDLLADLETVGALVVAVASKLRALDEGDEVGADDLHVDAGLP